MTAFDADFLDGFERLLRWRRDVRHFRRDPLPEAEVAAILASAALAPSVGNSQPWRLVRVRSTERRAWLAAHVDGAVRAAAPEGARGEDYARLKLHGMREAPEVIAVFSDECPAAGHGLGRATMPETLLYSTVLAIHTIWLTARARGVGVGWVSILDPVAVTAMLDVPDGWRFVALLCLGYPERESETPELERRGWQAREPLVLVER